MIKKVLDDEKVKKVGIYILKGEHFVITVHRSPDGDAIGSALALHRFLKIRGKNDIKVILPNDAPSFLKWMPGMEDVLVYEHSADTSDQLIKEADVIFCLDYNEPKRVGDMAESLLASPARKVMLDHHLNPNGFCKVTISHSEMSSTSELMFRLICALGDFELMDADCATCIYTGMMTDTGSFTYNSSDPELYIIIYELMRKGIDKDYIYKQVNQVYSLSRYRLMGFLLHEKMQVFPALHAALITMSTEEAKKFNFRTGDSEGFVNIPLNIKGIEFSVFLREDRDKVKVSLRSVGDFPCNTFAATYFNGGGHKNASGGEFSGSLKSAIEYYKRGVGLLNPLTYTQNNNNTQNE